MPGSHSQPDAQSFAEGSQRCMQYPRLDPRVNIAQTEPSGHGIVGLQTQLQYPKPFPPGEQKSPGQSASEWHGIPT
jgi:hypothetical protein